MVLVIATALVKVIGAVLWNAEEMLLKRYES